MTIPVQDFLVRRMPVPLAGDNVVGRRDRVGHVYFTIPHLKGSGETKA
jgi:hypothetical protein